MGDLRVAAVATPQSDQLDTSCFGDCWLVRLRRGPKPEPPMVGQLPQRLLPEAQSRHDYVPFRPIRSGTALFAVAPIPGLRGSSIF